jgi:4-amino-4-deoxy-L-arabinose transferase-like glycosyltransferase
MNRRQDVALIIGLFVAAIVVSTVFWAFLPAEFRENQSTDYLTQYEPVARAIIAGRGIVSADGRIATRYPPGFSVLLAGLFSLGDELRVTDEAMLAAFQLLCASLSVVLVYALARLIWSPGLALLPAAAWMTYPFFLWLTKQPNSELPFITVLYAGLYLFWRAALRGTGGPRAWALYLAAGLLTGAAMLIRPAAIGLSLIMALIILLFATRQLRWRARLGYGGLIILGSAVIVLPWEAAVYARSGQIIPLSTGGALSIQDGLTFLVAGEDYRREVDVPEDVAALMLNIHYRVKETRTMSGVASVIRDEAGRAPVAFAKLMIIKTARSWYGIDSRILETPTMLLQAVYLALILWGSVYVWRQGGALRRMIAGNWLIVLYFWAMTLLVVPLLRYMAPIMGLLMIALPGVYLSWAARRLPGASRPSSFSSDY